jgi:hypothetical protein
MIYAEVTATPKTLPGCSSQLSASAASSSGAMPAPPQRTHETLLTLGDSDSGARQAIVGQDAVYITGGAGDDFATVSYHLGNRFARKWLRTFPGAGTALAYNPVTGDVIVTGPAAGPRHAATTTPRSPTLADPRRRRRPRPTSQRVADLRDGARDRASGCREEVRLPSR